VVISPLLKFIRRQLRSGERFKSIAEGASVQNKLAQTTACCTLVSHTNNRRQRTLRCPAPWRAASPCGIQTMLRACTILRASFQRNYKNKQHEKRLLLLQMCRRLLALRTRIGVGNWRGPKSAGGGRSHDLQLARPGNPSR
jgi:hypothetical protein